MFGMFPPAEESRELVNLESGPAGDNFARNFFQSRILDRARSAPVARPPAPPFPPSLSVHALLAEQYRREAAAFAILRDVHAYASGRRQSLSRRRSWPFADPSGRR